MARSRRKQKGAKKPAKPDPNKFQSQPRRWTRTAAWQNRDKEATAGFQAVVDTYELLENVLLHLPIKDLLLSQRVCFKFKSTIEQSDKLQQALFFKAVPDDSTLRWDLCYFQLALQKPTPDPDLTNIMRSYEVFNNLCTEYPLQVVNPLVCRVASEIEHRPATIGGDVDLVLTVPEELPEHSSARRMLLTQPPTKEIRYDSPADDPLLSFEIEDARGIMVQDTYGQEDRPAWFSFRSMDGYTVTAQEEVVVKKAYAENVAQQKRIVEQFKARQVESQ